MRATARGAPPPSRRPGSNVGLGRFVALLALTISTEAEAQTTALRDDVLVDLAPGGLAALSINDFPVNTTVTGGTVAIEVEDRNCVPAPQRPCSYTIKALRLFLANFDFSGADVDGGSIVNAAPIRVTDEGSGLVIPTGTEFFGGFTVEGERRTATQRAPGGMILLLEEESQELTLVGGFVGSVEGFDINATLFASGVSPFKNLPPRANAGADASADCSGQVTLDGRASTDPANQPLTARWLLDGVAIASGLTASVRLARPTNTLELEVLDPFGGRDVDEVTVTVPPPETCVRPFVGCLLRTSSRRSVAIFGYENEALVNASIPVGTLNRFEPGRDDRGQPTVFLPARHEDAVRVGVLGLSPLRWRLGAALAAIGPHTPRCPCPEGTSPDRLGICRCPAGQVLEDDGRCRCPWPGQEVLDGACSCSPGERLLFDFDRTELPPWDDLPSGVPGPGGRSPFGLKCGAPTRATKEAP